MAIGSNKASANLGYFETIIPGTSQLKAFSSSSVQSTALGTQTSIVRVIASTSCHIKLAANPTAVADGTCIFLYAGVPEYFGCTGGDKIAVIRDAADGNLYITEGA